MLILKRKRKVLFFFFLLFFLFQTSSTFALEINYPSIPGATPPQDFVNTASKEEVFALYVKYVFVLILWVSGVIFFGSLLYAGFLYLTSAGSVDKIIRAREQVFSSFLGILLLFSCILILNTLGPQFAPSKIVPPPELTPAEEITIPSFIEKNYNSIISTELPLGYLIQERIFEGVIDPTAGKRIPRIRNNAQTTLAIAERIKENSKNLQTESKNCECKNATSQCLVYPDGCKECKKCYNCDFCDTPNLGCGDPFVLSEPLKNKLKEWGASDDQISSLEKQIGPNLTLFSLDPLCLRCKLKNSNEKNCFDCYRKLQEVGGGNIQCNQCTRCEVCPRTLDLEKLRQLGIELKQAENLLGCYNCSSPLGFNHPNCIDCSGCGTGRCAVQTCNTTITFKNIPCSSDPCKKNRTKIESLINQNLAEIGKLKKETLSRDPENPQNLIEEMEKSLKEAKELKAELKRLEELENFMENTCPPYLLRSYSANTAEQKFFNHKNWPFLVSKLFDDINIGTISAYKKSLRYTTFYCVTSGTIVGHPETEQSYQAALFDFDFLDPETEDDVIESLSEELSNCHAEVPVGEFIETAKRLGYKLVERLENLASLDQQLISAVDKLHILISQCSSRNCKSVCRLECWGRHNRHKKCVTKECKGDPCPTSEIEDQIKTINKIVSQITEVVQAQKNQAQINIPPGQPLEKHNIGIVTIIDNILPDYLYDFDATVRTYMQNCFTPYYVGEQHPERISALISCQSALGGGFTFPFKLKARPTCLDPDPNTRDWYDQCFTDCYLKWNNGLVVLKYYDGFKMCFENCLKKTADQRNEEDIKGVIHKLNFFCCGQK